MRSTIAAILVLLGLAAPAGAQDTVKPVRAAVVVDLPSGAVLMAQNGDRSLPPASMSKLMTLYLVFEALEKKVISLTQEARTSSRAARMLGSRMYLREGQRVSIENLILGVIVHSGNDASVALAEAVAGTEAAFVERMNQRARDLGLTKSHFANTNGWPDPKHRMSARDLATLAGRLIADYPQYYDRFARREFAWNGKTQRNRNRLLGQVDGVDGIKTGHTEEAGFGLVASARRGERRVVVVVTGLGSDKERNEEATRLINWAFRSFETKKVYDKGADVIAAKVWIGAVPAVMLTTDRPVTISAPYGTLGKAKLAVRYNGPVAAPITAGQRIGQLEITVPELAPIIVPLFAKTGVEEGGILTRLQAAAALLLGNLDPG